MSIINQSYEELLPNIITLSDFKQFWEEAHLVLFFIKSLRTIKVIIDLSRITFKRALSLINLPCTFMFLGNIRLNNFTLPYEFINEYNLSINCEYVYVGRRLKDYCFWFLGKWASFELRCYGPKWLSYLWTA